MTKDKVLKIIDEVYPKIEKHYGFSKFQECTPYIELHKNIYEKYSGEDGASGVEDGCHAEYCSMMNEISIYYPNMKSKRMIIETLIHEYIHYLQSPIWFKRYYDKYGHDYTTHPYEIAAVNEEKNYKLFI